MKKVLMASLVLMAATSANARTFCVISSKVQQVQSVIAQFELTKEDHGYFISKDGTKADILPANGDFKAYDRFLTVHQEKDGVLTLAGGTVKWPVGSGTSSYTLHGMANGAQGAGTGVALMLPQLGLTLSCSQISSK